MLRTPWPRRCYGSLSFEARSCQGRKFFISNTSCRKIWADELVLGWAFPGFVQGVCGYGAPVAVAAPLLVGLGFEPIFAAATALIGHSWAVTFGSLGSSFSILERLTTLDPGRLALFAALFLGIACVLCGYSIAHMYGGWKCMHEGTPAILILWALS